MNARQKAKKYKKIAELYRIKAEAHDRYLKAESIRRANHEMMYGTIETIKIVKYWDDGLPKEFVKKEIAEAFAEFCLENDLISLKEEQKREPYLNYTRIIGTMRVAKKWGDAE